ncbi:MAG: hypothetical protein ACE5IB_06290, partial [Candidatus Geothermarchaeales archaeon]
VEFGVESWKQMVPEDVFRVLLPEYDELKDDSYRLGSALDRLMSRSWHMIMGGKGRAALGETYRRETEWGVYTFDLLPE